MRGTFRLGLAATNAPQARQREIIIHGVSPLITCRNFVPGQHSTRQGDQARTPKFKALAIGTVDELRRRLQEILRHLSEWLLTKAGQRRRAALFSRSTVRSTRLYSICNPDAELCPASKLGQSKVCLGDPPCGSVRDPDVKYLALTNDIVQTAHHFFHWRDPYPDDVPSTGRCTRFAVVSNWLPLLASCSCDDCPPHSDHCLARR